MGSETPDRLGQALARLYLIMCLLFLAASLIHLLPEHRRQMVKLRLLRSSAQVTSRLARRTAAASMARELATGEQLYGLPYWLATTRDRLAGEYDRQRGAL